MRRFHQLEAAAIRRIHPTRLIGHTFWQHPPLGPEAFSDCRNILEMFDDHEEHDGRIADAIELINETNN